MKNINQNYTWEIEHSDGRIYRQYDENGREQSSKKCGPAETVVRVSIIPAIKKLPRHDILIDRACGDRFVKRFCRGVVGGNNGLVEYLQVIVTNRYRVYVFSDGRVTVTNKNHDVYAV